MPVPAGSYHDSAGRCSRSDLPLPPTRERRFAGSAPQRGARRALFAGDDATDLDAFGALDGLELGIRVAVDVAEAPAELSRLPTSRSAAPTNCSSCSRSPVGAPRRPRRRIASIASAARNHAAGRGRSRRATPTKVIAVPIQKAVLEPFGERDRHRCSRRTASDVVDVATVERIAMPTAPPICCDVLIRPDARPASCGVVPASAAIVSGTNANGIPSPMTRKPGEEIRPVGAVRRDLREEERPTVNRDIPTTRAGLTPTRFTAGRRRWPR